jgi:hypothetical protein
MERLVSVDQIDSFESATRVTDKHHLHMLHSLRTIVVHRCRPFVATNGRTIDRGRAKTLIQLDSFYFIRTREHGDQLDEAQVPARKTIIESTRTLLR